MMPGPSNQLAEGFSTAIGDGGSVRRADRFPSPLSPRSAGSITHVCTQPHSGLCHFLTLPTFHIRHRRTAARSAPFEGHRDLGEI